VGFLVGATTFRSGSEGRRFESDLGLQNRRSEGISDIVDFADPTRGHSFGLDHRAAGAPSQRLPSTTLSQVSRAWVEPVRSLLDAPSPAVLTTYRKDGSAHTVPVWFRWVDDAFEVVIAKGDVKLRHLARNPQCVLVVFEAVRPFRGLEVRGVAELVEGDVTSARAAIAGRYLGVGDGERFAVERRSTPGILLRLIPDSPRVWDLSGILPR
jgi:PPOX class probable F420-dependent enzyme